MNSADKEAFEKWSDGKAVWELDSKTIWQAACEYKDKEYETLYDNARDVVRQAEDRLAECQAREVKLREELTLIASDYASDSYVGDAICAREALAPPAQPTIPEGWKLVPIEPQDWAKEAIRRADDYSWQTQYRDLIAAAPEYSEDKS